MPSMRVRRIRALAILLGLVAVTVAAVAFVSRDDDGTQVSGQASGSHGALRSTDPASATDNSTLPTSPSPSAATGFDTGRARAAVAYAKRHHMDSSVAIIDTRTGAMSTAGDPDREYPTASVIKTLIATRVLLEGDMSGETEKLADTMITQSDNDAAYALYPQVGGDDVLPWIARHYGIHHLGQRPAYAGFWGSTLITAGGMARLYAAIRADRRVWPWLSNAMHHHQAVTTAGEPNDFGLAALAAPTAVKNGWNVNRDKKHPDDADINSTGFADHNRYAVIILSQGPQSLYFVGGEKIVTHQAMLLFPSGTT